MARHALALGLFCVVSLALTWPLVLHLDTHIPGPVGDNVTFVWNFWWARQALASDTARLFETTAAFYPFGTSLVLHTHTALPALIGATALSSLSPLAAQNVVILASVALNGFAAYLLAWMLTRSWPAAVIAGLYFGASPFIAGHLLGHFNLIVAWSLPTFALLWLVALEKPSLPAAIAAGAVLGATAWTDYYLTVYLLLFSALALISRWITISWSLHRRRARPLDRAILWLCALLLLSAVTIRVTGGGVFYLGQTRVSATTGLPLLTSMWCLLLLYAWRRWSPVPRPSWIARSARRDLTSLIAVGATFLVASWPLVIEAWRILSRDEYVAPKTYLRSASEGIDPIGLFIGTPFHPIWGRPIQSLYDTLTIFGVENTAWLGLVGIGLLVVTRFGLTLPDTARPGDWCSSRSSYGHWDRTCVLPGRTRDSTFPTRSSDTFR